MFAQRKLTIYSAFHAAICSRHACDLPRVSRGGGEPPARVPHDKTFPRKALSPLLRFFKKKYFAVCGRQRGASPHTPPPLKRRAKLLFLHKLRFERIGKTFALSKPTICSAPCAAPPTGLDYHIYIAYRGYFVLFFPVFSLFSLYIL